MLAHALRTLPFALFVCLLMGGPAHAQAPTAPAPEAGTPEAGAPDAGAPGPAAPAWLQVPAALPPGWRVQDATDDSVTFAEGETRLTLVRQSGSANELLAALATQVGGEVGGSPALYHVSFGGPWVQGRVVEGKDRAGARAVVAARRLKGDHVVTVIARGSKRGRGVGEALDLLSRVRFAGDGTPSPYAPLNLEGRPEARINPVGLFVVLAEGWKPQLVKGQSSFWLRHKTGNLRYAKAGSDDLRRLKTKKAVEEAYPGYTVQPLFWLPPGSYRAWQLLKLSGNDVSEVRAVHLVRYKKLDDWSFHLVEVEGVDPLRGFAHVRSLLRRLKMIP